MRWVRGFLKESGATGYAQGGERCYGSLDNGVQNLLPGDFLWIVHRNICFKGFVFFCHSGQRRGICGHKNDCIQILHFVQNNSFISERQIFTETQVYFRVTVSFQKGKIRSDFRSPESLGVFFRLVIWSGSLSRQVHGVFPRFQGFNRKQSKIGS